ALAFRPITEFVPGVLCRPQEEDRNYSNLGAYRCQLAGHNAGNQGNLQGSSYLTK
ncbi:unnamed protein product, partial [Nesidiocoris tenuis]